MTAALLGLLAVILPFVMEALSRALEAPRSPDPAQALAEALAAQDGALLARVWALHDEALHRAGIPPQRPPDAHSPRLPPRVLLPQAP
jgi:hypothetical protein